MIIDKLYKRVEQKGNVCVGLDTALDYIPEEFGNKFNTVSDKIFSFNKEIIDATEDLAAIFKVQIAYYEALGLQGLDAYGRTLEYLRKKDNLIIADVKRGDISKTAQMYAKAHFTGEFEADFMTISPYMGMDSIEPYSEYIAEKQKGLFVLVKTSNSGSADFQYKKNDEDKYFYEVIGERVQEFGKEYIGSCGYSSVGGVVGCTNSLDAKSIREKLKNTYFLIPGYGAQGGKGKDIESYLDCGNGGIVNSSRGILLSYKKEIDGEKRFAECSRDAVIKMRDDINSFKGEK